MSNHRSQQRLIAYGMAAFIAIALFFASSVRSYAESSPNFALHADGAAYPAITASYTCCTDNVSYLNDGLYDFNDGAHHRWTSWPQTTVQTVDIDFGQPVTFNQVNLYLFNDGGGVQPPSSYAIQFWDDGAWTNVANESHTPATPTAKELLTANSVNTLNTALFNAVTSTKARVVLTPKVELDVHGNPLYTASVGLVELEIFGPPTTDTKLLTAFGSSAGGSVSVTVSSVLDAAYSMPANRFQLAANGVPVDVLGAVPNPFDPGGHTLTLLLPNEALLGNGPLTLSLSEGAIRTAAGQSNLAIPAVPVIAFAMLDQTADYRFGIDDLVRIAANPAQQIDVNRNGSFDRQDLQLLLGKISLFPF